MFAKKNENAQYKKNNIQKQKKNFILEVHLENYRLSYVIVLLLLCFLLKQKKNFVCGMEWWWKFV